MTITTDLIRGTENYIESALEVVDRYAGADSARMVRSNLELALANQRALLAEVNGATPPDTENTGTGLAFSPLAPIELRNPQMTATDIRLSIAMALIDKGYGSGVVVAELGAIYDAVIDRAELVV